jgi:ribose transport system substrate-binding protein
MKTSAVSIGLVTAAMLVSACGGSTDKEKPSAIADLGSSLKCDYSPTEAELLAYKVPKAPDGTKLTLMQVSSAGYYYQAISQGAEQAAKDAGVKLTEFSADGYASPDQQLQQVGDALVQGTDGIVMAPSDIKGSVPVVTQAKEDDVPVVNISSEVDSKDVYMVMQDDYAFGQLAADRVAEVMGEAGGTGIVIAGPSNATWSQRRTQGFEDRVKEKYPKLKIAAAPTQLVDPAEGLRSFEDAAQATPNIDWIFAVHYFILPPDSLPAAYKGKATYVSAGYEPDSIKALENGTLDSTFGLAPRWMGILGVGRLVELLNGDKPPRITCLPVPLFTKAEINSPFANAELIP